MLKQEEYVEQAYWFGSMGRRMDQNEPIQDLLAHVREEVLATSKLPLALEFILTEVNHAGTMASAMKRLSHYFAPFQIFLMEQAEDEFGRFDMFVATTVLEQEAQLCAAKTPCGTMFFYQFEVLARNRLNYDYGLEAISKDPIYDESWRDWILQVRRDIGIVDLADLVYIHSEHYLNYLKRQNSPEQDSVPKCLFGEKEGRIALANRRKEPSFFFSALQRQLGYPPARKPRRENQEREQQLKMQRTITRLETRVKLLEDEQRESGIDLTKFYQSPQKLNDNE